MILCVALLVAPWMIRNSMAYGRAAGFMTTVGWGTYRGLADQAWLQLSRWC